MTLHDLFQRHELSPRDLRLTLSDRSGVSCRDRLVIVRDVSERVIRGLHCLTHEVPDGLIDDEGATP
jgi:hypothetical protein